MLPELCEIDRCFLMRREVISLLKPEMQPNSYQMKIFWFSSGSRNKTRNPTDHLASPLPRNIVNLDHIHLSRQRVVGPLLELFEVNVIAAQFGSMVVRSPSLPQPTPSRLLDDWASVDLDKSERQV